MGWGEPEMKKWKRLFLLLFLCLTVSQTASLPGLAPATVKAAAKEGLKSEKGKYYFYVAGKKIKNKWRTIVEGTTEYRYYFDKTGTAVTGRKSGGIVTPKVYKIKGKSYGFDNKGHMVKGLYVIDGEFYLFGSADGAYKPAVTKKLRAAAKEGQRSSRLVSLLKAQVGNPISREDFPDSCYGDGKDGVLYYPGFMVQLFTDRKGKTTVVCVNATAREEQPETTAPGAETSSTETPGAETSSIEAPGAETSSTEAPGAETLSTEAPGAETSSTEAPGAETSSTETPSAETPSTETAASEAQTEAEEIIEKKGLVEINGSYYFFKKDGSKLKNTWKTVDGYTYYFRKNGKAQTYNAKVGGKIYVFDRKGRLKKGRKSRIVTVGVRKYYVDASGCAITGWHVVGGKLYYADARTGLLYQNRSYGGIKFSGTGAAENSTSAKLKIKTMSIVASITNGSMSRSQKLRACWNYVVSGRFSYGSRYPNLGQGGWQRETALHMLTNHWGNCYSFACAFAALAKEVGYSPYVICGRVSGSRDGAADGLTRHAWVQIDGAYYDPEAQYAGWARGIYGAGGYYVAHQIQAIVAF